MWRAQDDLLQSVPGVGPIVSAVLLAELPELGVLTHKQIATLAGVAPLARDSGTLRGRRMVWGGRAGVRTALYLAALCGRRWHPQSASVLRTAPRRREADEGRAHRLCPETADDPQRDGAGQRSLEGLGPTNPTQLLTVCG